MNNRFMMTCAFIEMVVWTALVPYLIWQQWHWSLAVGLLAWWLLGYWRLTFKGLRQMYQMRKRIKETLRNMGEDMEIREDVVEDVGNADDDDIHRWIDNGGRS